MEMTGYTNEEIREKPFIEFIYPEDRSKAFEQYQKRLSGESAPMQYPLRVLNKAGKTLWFQLKGNLIIWENKTAALYMFTDITEQKEAEKALKDSEEKYRLIVENNNDVVFTFDRAEQLVYMSSSIKKALGYNPADLIGHTFESLVHPDDLPGLREAIQRNIKDSSQTIGGNEYRVRHASGEWRWHNASGNATFDANGKFLNFTAIAKDITERKNVELALQASEQNFRNSIDSSLLGIRIMGDHDYTLYANQALLDMFGYKNIEELRTSPPQEHYTPESHTAFVQRHEQFLRGESLPDQLEFDIIRKDGAIRHLQLFNKEVLWNGKQQHQFVYNDITERKQAEAALKASEQNFRNSLDSSNISTRISDKDDQTSYVNQALLDTFGYKDIGEVRTSPPNEHYTPESYASYVLRHEKMLRGEPMPNHVEIDMERKDGTIRHLDVSMKLIYWDGRQQYQTLYSDITEQKQAQETIEKATEEWRTTFDSISDLIMIHDKDNRIVKVNKAAADLLKTTTQELIGKFCQEVMRGDQECPVNCPQLLALKTGKSSSLEIFNPTLGLHFQESASPLFNEKGEITGTVLVARDVTQQKRMEEQLILTDRLASIGELSSGIAHELNNPLTSVIGFSQLLMEGDVPANMKEDLGIVYSEAQRAAAIVKNLLTFARKHAPVKQLSQVNAVIDDVSRLRAYEQKVNNIEVENRLSPNLPEIMIDHFQMQQVFLNIIVNAEFSMQEAHHKGKLVITTEKYGDAIRVIFTDDGPGISKENLKHIFDPFFTTKEVGKGTGLGLSICHGIVSEHGGKIYARSEKGHGTTFVVELPLINGQ
jgi:PAS domain S-box-containing protein